MEKVEKKGMDPDFDDLIFPIEDKKSPGG